MITSPWWLLSLEWLIIAVLAFNVGRSAPQTWLTQRRSIDDVRGLYGLEGARYDVVLEAAGSKKIQVIRAVRQSTGLSLTGAKNFVEHLPLAIKGVDAEAAQQLRNAFESAGATVSVRAR